eukprot:1786060-Lingulodinium_polyedra.AAC.1
MLEAWKPLPSGGLVLSGSSGLRCRTQRLPHTQAAPKKAKTKDPEYEKVVAEMPWAAVLDEKLGFSGLSEKASQ